ncbi:MAG: MFS transporter [Haloferacaceae archaeon]
MNANDRALTGFTMLGHATFHTYELVIPLFVVAWLDEFGLTPAVLGVVVGASYALTGLGALPAGLLADAYSAKRLVLLCIAGMAAGFALLAAAQGLATVAAGLLVWGAASSVYHPAGLALISRGAEARGSAFAYHGIAGNVGVAVGPLLGAVLLVFLDWRAVVLALVAPAVVALVAATRLEFDETAGSVAREADGGRDAERLRDLRTVLSDSKVLFAGGFALVFLIGNLYGLYYRGVFTFLPEVLAGFALFDPVTLGGRSIEPSQYVYSGLLVFGAAGQYVGGWLVDRVPAERALVGSFVALALVAVVFVPASAAGLVPLLVAAALLGFLVFMEAPINQEVVSRHVPPAARGLSFGYTYLAVFGVGAAGAAGAGVVLTRASPAALFGALAAVAVLAAVIGVVLVRRFEPRGETAVD